MLALKRPLCTVLYRNWNWSLQCSWDQVCLAVRERAKEGKKERKSKEDDATAAARKFIPIGEGLQLYTYNRIQGERERGREREERGEYLLLRFPPPPAPSARPPLSLLLIFSLKRGSAARKPVSLSDSALRLHERECFSSARPRAFGKSDGRTHGLMMYTKGCVWL